MTLNQSPNLHPPLPEGDLPRTSRRILSRRIVAIGASTGGLAAFSTILGALPKNFPAPIVLVQHLSAEYPSSLVSLLSRRTPLDVKEAEQGDRLRAGHVYVAPPGKHLLVGTDLSLSLSLSPKVHHSRPSVDVLFRSVAACCAAETIAVVLTGGDGDGSAGIQAIKAAGGVTIAQDLASSQQPSMPHHAAATGSVDFVLPLPSIAEALIILVAPKVLELKTEVPQTALGQTALGQTALGQTALGQTALGQTALGRVQYSLHKARTFCTDYAVAHPVSRLVTTALAEMEECLEALRTAEEALRAQNEALEEFPRALRREHRRFEALVSSVPEAIITTDRSGIVRGVSPAAAQMLGVTPRYLIGRPFTVRALEGERLVLARAVAQALSAGTAPQSFGLKVRRGLASVSATASVIADEKGVITDLLWRLQPEAGSTP